MKWMTRYFQTTWKQAHGWMYAERAWEVEDLPCMGEVVGSIPSTGGKESATNEASLTLFPVGPGVEIAASLLGRAHSLVFDRFPEKTLEMVHQGEIHLASCCPQCWILNRHVCVLGKPQLGGQGPHGWSHHVYPTQAAEQELCHWDSTSVQVQGPSDQKGHMSKKQRFPGWLWISLKTEWLKSGSSRWMKG